MFCLLKEERVLLEQFGATDDQQIGSSLLNALANQLSLMNHGVYLMYKELLQPRVLQNVAPVLLVY